MLGTPAVRLAALALFVWTGAAGAQEQQGDSRHSPYQLRPFELNLHAGGYRPDSADDTDVGVGGRFFRHTRSGLGLGGSFTWVTSDSDVSTYLYSGQLEYTFPGASRFQPFLGAGIGAATVKFSGAGSGALTLAPAGLRLANDEDHHHDGDTETNWMVPVGGGFRARVWEGIAARLDIRDNMIWVPLHDATTGEEDGHEVSHNWEVSGGVSVVWGQFRAQRGLAP